MFGAIAPRYDLLNHLLSFNLDRAWRREAVEALSPAEGGLYLDLCTGTGDLALAMLRRTRARIIGADVARPMLALARKKAKRKGVDLPLLEADALSLPFPSDCLDGLAVAFGVRNFEDLDRGLKEMARVLKPGGRACILEFSDPRGRLFGPLFKLYFRKVLPVVGGLVSGGFGAYAYLPATVRLFPGCREMARRLDDAGLEIILQKPLTFGVAIVHLAGKPPAPAF